MWPRVWSPDPYERWCPYNKRRDKKDAHSQRKGRWGQGKKAASASQGKRGPGNTKSADASILNFKPPKLQVSIVRATQCVLFCYGSPGKLIQTLGQEQRVAETDASKHELGNG